MKYVVPMVFLVSLMLIPAAASGAVINVPGDFSTIQGAIDAAAGFGDEIVVAPGTYGEVINFGGKAINLHSASGDPKDTIIDGTGLNESVVLCISGEGAGTILEGFTITGGTGHQIPGIIDGGGMYNNNSNPTVTNCIFSENASVDNGGGMYNFSSSPTITNCTFSGNSANYGGGGMFNLSNSSPIVTDCTFIGNSAASGGGIFNDYFSSPTIMSCTFSGNTAVSHGGGMFNIYSKPTVANCTFIGNTASQGGGLSIVSSGLTVTNCTFNGNSATYGGGGMFIDEGLISVINCTFIENSSVDGGGIHNSINSSPVITNCAFIGNLASGDGGGMFNRSSSYPTVSNCVLWGDSPDEMFNSTSSPSFPSIPTISFSNVQGGIGVGSIDGGGNIDVDPLFVDADGVDNIPGTLDDDLRLGAFSPGVDAGDNGAPGLVGIIFDLDGLPRFFDDAGVVDTGNGSPGAPGIPIVDMGAYERQVDSVAVCGADIMPPGGNGVVNIDDLVAVLNGFGVCPIPPLPCDADIVPAGPPAGNGVVNIDDLVAVLNSFGGCP